jgi:pimeloyl-ACP methyl ester carboxylesterase
LSEALVLLHGFTDTPRTWELVRPRLESRYRVLAPALPGHLGGPPLDGTPDAQTLPDAIEQAMDEAGIGFAHVAGNSLGGYVALKLAERGRALSVVALAPGGGWETDAERDETLDFFAELRRPIEHAAPYADRIASTPAGRRRATQYIVGDGAALPPDLVAHQIRGAAACEALPLIEVARDGYPPGFLARYFEKLRYRFGPRERAGLYTFLEMAHEVGELAEVPELRFVTAGATV